jgi:hypothetical protein
MVMPQKQAWVYTVDRRVRRSKEEGWRGRTLFINLEKVGKEGTEYKEKEYNLFNFKR